jgi:hypothetical protein
LLSRLRVPNFLSWLSKSSEYVVSVVVVVAEKVAMVAALTCWAGERGVTASEMDPQA